MAPELINPEEYGLDKTNPTKESDIYSLGMLIYEVSIQS
jgi:serine/threonine protein kinase